MRCNAGSNNGHLKGAPHPVFYRDLPSLSPKPVLWSHMPSQEEGTSGRPGLQYGALEVSPQGRRAARPDLSQPHVRTGSWLGNRFTPMHRRFVHTSEVGGRCWNNTGTFVNCQDIFRLWHCFLLHCLSPASYRHLMRVSIRLALRLAEALAGWAPGSSPWVTRGGENNEAVEVAGAARGGSAAGNEIGTRTGRRPGYNAARLTMKDRNEIVRDYANPRDGSTA